MKKQSFKVLATLETNPEVVVEVRFGQIDPVRSRVRVCCSILLDTLDKLFPSVRPNDSLTSSTGQCLELPLELATVDQV